MAVGAPQKSLWRTIRESEFVVIFITSFWLMVVLQYYIPMLLLLPLSLVPGVGVHWYRQLSGWYDVHWGRHSCLSIPFSWCGCRIYINDFEFLMNFKEKVSSRFIFLFFFHSFFFSSFFSKSFSNFIFYFFR
jgi:hypothetical protein